MTTIAWRLGCWLIALATKGHNVRIDVRSKRPTLCDSDCASQCHEGHEVRWKQAHSPDACGLTDEDPTPEEFDRMLAAGEPVTLNVRCRPTSPIRPDSANSANR